MNSRKRGAHPTNEQLADDSVVRAPVESDTASEDTVGSESVAERAYRRFQDRGGEHGHDLEDWLEAERELSDGRGE